MIESEEKKKYKVHVNNRSRTFLNRFDHYQYSKILEKIFCLENEPRPSGCTKLSVKDGFRIKSTHSGKFTTCLLTFVPPLFFVYFFPKGFSFALQFAAIFVMILLAIMPALMVWRLKEKSRGF